MQDSKVLTVMVWRKHSYIFGAFLEPFMLDIFIICCRLGGFKMKTLDQNIEEKKLAMYAAISKKGLMHPDTIELSEELDVLIVERMRRDVKICVK